MCRYEIELGSDGCVEMSVDMKRAPRLMHRESRLCESARLVATVPFVTLG